MPGAEVFKRLTDPAPLTSPCWLSEPCGRIVPNVGHGAGSPVGALPPLHELLVDKVPAKRCEVGVELLQSLMRSYLVDRYMLMIHPLVLGSGRRMFTEDGSFAALKLIDSKTTTTGVVIATYEPASGDR